MAKKEITTITEKTDEIQELWARRVQIKYQISKLQQEDSEVVEKLNSLIGLNMQTDKVQHFDIDGLKLKATPKIYRNVDTERAKILLAEDPDARMYQDIFKEKYELSTSKWKALTPDQQAIFVSCITVSSGKPQHEEE